jgi:octaprenyl-diphosphate synthase
VGSLPALRILSNAAAVIAEGEVMQLAAAKDTATTEKDYLAIIAAKTAALFSAATEVGAAIADRSTDEQAALRSYGLNLGIVFQLVDDALDYAGESASLGKSTGDDFREGKITLPVILSVSRGGEQEHAFWQRTLGEGRIDAGDFEHAVGLMKSHGAIEATLDRARHYGALACGALAELPPGPSLRALTDVVEFCIGRGS